ncbi:MAG: energy-coupling factor transporter transmembrane component T [Lactobacillus sp.]|nr:energy-coupling factor transporter transmembrane component T [Lactobacillus sp.]
MNPSFKLILCLIVSIMCAIHLTLWGNLAIITASILYLLWHKKSLKLLLYTLPAAIAVYFTGQSGLALATRIYAYLLMFAVAICNVSASTMVRSLNQNLHLPTSFCYGIASAVNILPILKSTYLEMQASAKMRGQKLHFYSPRLYLKMIIIANQIAGNLDIAMQSKEFTDDRSQIITVPVKISDYLLFTAILAVTSLMIWTT